MQIPNWIEPEAMDGFVEMRKIIKKPLTAYAMRLVIHKLEAFKAKGHDANAVLEQSTFNNWQGLYPVKEEVIPNLLKTYYEPEARMTPEQRESAERARKLAMSALKVVGK